MERLYLEIEMPLIYSLHHMEQEGIQVEKEALQTYGETLKVQIDRWRRRFMSWPARNSISILPSSWA